MPKIKVDHYNPPETQGLTRCGLSLKRHQNWTTDPNDATCNNCVKLIRMDNAKKTPAPQG